MRGVGVGRQRRAYAGCRRDAGVLRESGPARLIAVEMEHDVVPVPRQFVVVRTFALLDRDMADARNTLLERAEEPRVQQELPFLALAAPHSALDLDAIHGVR